MSVLKHYKRKANVQHLGEVQIFTCFNFFSQYSHVENSSLKGLTADLFFSATEAELRLSGG